MSFINTYKAAPLQEQHGSFGPDPYDLNFIFLLHLATLESECIKLTPFTPALYAQQYIDHLIADPSIQRWMPFNHRTLDNFLIFLEGRIRSDPGCTLLAIIDKPSGKFAGVIGLLNTSLPNLCTEIGPVIVFPAFQRTYVASHAIGLMLRYCLELPTAALPGLGLRRVQWTANPMNAASVKAAQKVGFKVEGTMRWTWVLVEGKEGKAPREGDPRGVSPGRDSILLAICGDDWENGAREDVRKLIDRV